MSAGWRLAPYPAYGPCGLPLIWPQNPGGAAAYRGYSAVRFGSPEKAQCVAGHYQRVSASQRSPDSV
ncbi:hypothetical protein B9037_002790 [Klebsiella aerogenes]|nr:hypothetical protein B9037_002790 [Klebsiella aerogenes]